MQFSKLFYFTISTCKRTTRTIETYVSWTNQWSPKKRATTGMLGYMVVETQTAYGSFSETRGLKHWCKCRLVPSRTAIFRALLRSLFWLSTQCYEGFWSYSSTQRKEIALFNRNRLREETILTCQCNFAYPRALLFEVFRNELQNTINCNPSLEHRTSICCWEWKPLVLFQQLSFSTLYLKCNELYLLVNLAFPIPITWWHSEICSFVMFIKEEFTQEWICRTFKENTLSFATHYIYIVKILHKRTWCTHTPNCARKRTQWNDPFVTFGSCACLEDCPIVRNLHGWSI